MGVSSVEASGHILAEEKVAEKGDRIGDIDQGVGVDPASHEDLRRHKAAVGEKEWHDQNHGGAGDVGKFQSIFLLLAYPDGVIIRGDVRSWFLPRNPEATCKIPNRVREICNPLSSESRQDKLRLANVQPTVKRLFTCLL